MFSRPVYVPPFNRNVYIGMFIAYQILTLASNILVFFPCKQNYFLTLDLDYVVIFIIFAADFVISSILYFFVCKISPGKVEKNEINAESFVLHFQLNLENHISISKS